MKTRCSLPTIIAAFVVACAALFLAPHTSHAQVLDCSFCNHFTFAVNGAVNCPITICYSLTPGGPVICRTVAPGTSAIVPCPLATLTVNTCSGPYSIIPGSSAAICSPHLTFAALCCGRVCSVPSVDVCPKLEVQAEPCSSVSCP